MQDNVTQAEIEAAMKARVPGGSEVWAWLPQKDAWTPHETAYAVMQSALEAAAAHRLASTAQPEVKALVEAADEAMQVIWQYKNDLHFPPSSDSMGRRLARASEVASQVERALAAYHEAQP